MNCKLISCSNKDSVGVEFVGKKDVLKIERCFYFGSLRSSKIKNIEFDEDLVIIVTKNSIYKFKEV